MSTLREALSALEVEGRLTPHEVVEEARTTPGSALHGHIFGVPDDLAAERYRLIRARDLIRSFRVTRPEGGPTTRQFVSVTPGQPYKATEVVVADPLSEKLLHQAMEREIAYLQRKYGHLKEFGELVRARLLGEQVAS